MSSPLPFVAHVPPLLATATAFLPPLAAAWARRSIREPAGQIAVGWLVMALAGAVGAVRFFFLHLAPGTSVSLLIPVLFPLLLLPPMAAWIGGAARRWQWPVLGAWCVLWAMAAAELPGSRVFKVLVDPVMATGMGVASAWALAAQARRATGDVRRTDWFWILVGHVMYFTVDMIRHPLIESLVARGWDAAKQMEVHAGIMFLFCAVYAAIARGMLLRPEEAPPRAPAAVAVGQPA